MKLSELLLNHINILGISQNEFARRSDKSKAFVSEILRDKRGISADTALNFSRVLGISAEMIYHTQQEERLKEAFKRSQHDERRF